MEVTFMSNVEKCKYCGTQGPNKVILAPEIKEKQWECPECKEKHKTKK